MFKEGHRERKDDVWIDCPFLQVLGMLNEGTTTGLMTDNGLFKRAFLLPGICRAAFPHTTKIIGLDACHVKASYGGVLLVMTFLDGNGSVFPGAVAVAE